MPTQTTTDKLAELTDACATLAKDIKGLAIQASEHAPHLVYELTRIATRFDHAWQTRDSSKPHKEWHAWNEDQPIDRLLDIADRLTKIRGEIIKEIEAIDLSELVSSPEKFARLIDSWEKLDKGWKGIKNRIKESGGLVLRPVTLH